MILKKYKRQNDPMWKIKNIYFCDINNENYKTKKINYIFSLKKNKLEQVICVDHYYREISCMEFSRCTSAGYTK